MPFTIRDGEWKILSGIRLNQPDVANVLRTFMYPDGFLLDIGVATMGDVLFELEKEVDDMF